MSTLKATNIQHASAANPAIVLAADGSATANVSSINSGPLAGFRNAIINGNFDIWQRGTSFSNPANGAYLADRWMQIFNGSGATRTISRQSFALGQTDVPGEPSYFFRYDQSVAGTGATSNSIQQRIESVRTFAGQQVTLSFYAKATSAITVPNIKINQNFGTGGSPSATVGTDFVANLAIGTSWAKYSFTTAVPSISGKTLGSDNNDCANIAFDLPLNTIFTFDIAQVQVERGPVATPFERRPIGTELALCQRYYEIHDGQNLALAPRAATAFNTESFVTYPYKVNKRVIPTASATYTNLTSPSAELGLTNCRFTGTANNTAPGRVNNGFTFDAEL